jgi:uncharacterized membrane protein
LPALALIFNAFVWGVSWFPFRQLEGHGLHPVWATCLIYAAVTLAMALLRRRVWGLFARQPALLGLGLAAGLTNVGFNWAVTQGDVVRVVLLFYLMPLWSVLLAWAFLGERPSLAALARVALALAGVAVVLKSPQADWPVPASLADWLGVAAGFGFAVTNILLRRLRSARRGPGTGDVRRLRRDGRRHRPGRHRARRDGAAAAGRPGLVGLGAAAGHRLRVRQRLPAIRRGPAGGQRDLGDHAVGGAVRERLLGGAGRGHDGSADLARRRADRGGGRLVGICARTGGRR